MAISLAYPLPRLYSCDIISLGIAHNQLEGIPIGYIHQYQYCCTRLVAGVGFEPHDLQVMSLASYRTALPRDSDCYYTLFQILCQDSF